MSGMCGEAEKERVECVAEESGKGWWSGGSSASKGRMAFGTGGVVERGVGQNLLDFG